MTAEEFGIALRRHKIEPEYVNSEWAVLMASPFNTEEDFANVAKFIEDTAGNGCAAPEERLSHMPQRALSIREATFAESVLIKTKDACKRTAASLVMPCPPCIALASPGEIIDEKLQNLLIKYGIDEINVVK